MQKGRAEHDCVSARKIVKKSKNNLRGRKEKGGRGKGKGKGKGKGTHTVIPYREELTVI
jgi:hypothetical protein